MMGGVFAPELKFAGYDKLILAQQISESGLYMDQ